MMHLAEQGRQSGSSVLTERKIGTLASTNNLVDPGRVVSVLMSTDSRFLQHAAVCLTSLLVNNPDLAFDIVIVSRPTESLDEEKLRRTLRLFFNHSLSFLKFQPPPDRTLPLYEYTIDTWTRLWIEEFFPKHVDRVLYLDSDLVVTGNITQLWRTELEGALLAAVDIPGAVSAIPLLEDGSNWLGIQPDEGYFNAGVLIIDLKQWRDTRALDTVLAYVEANPDRVPNVDQDALNACFHARRKRLEYKWNLIRPFFRDPPVLPLSQGEMKEALEDARIIHFNGSLKPWNYFSDHPRKNEYAKYLRLTEWRDYVPPDRTPVNMLRKAVSAILPRPIKGALRTVKTRFSE
jgi:lipopolysaccharide biosynthesis glycosyltransferase